MGVDRLNDGNRPSGILVETMSPLDDFQFAVAIHMG